MLEMGLQLCFWLKLAMCCFWVILLEDCC